MVNRIVVLVILLTVIFTIPVQGQQQAPFSIQADNLTIDRAENIVRARGQVRIDLTEISVLAEEVEIDLNTDEILATGKVTYIKGDKELVGEKLLYDYETEAGKFWKARGKWEGKKFAGERIELVEDDLKLAQATVTSCANPEAHYKLVARQATIRPDKVLVARNVEVWLGKYHILTYPSYKISLEDSRELTPVPTFGYNTDDGAYMELDYEHYITPDLEGDIDLKLTSRNRDELRLDYEYEGIEQITLNPIFDYDQEDRWYSQLKLNGDFAYGFELDTNIKYNKPVESEEGDVRGDIQLRQQRDRFYWQLERDYNKALVYRPQLTLGLFDKKITDWGLIANARYRRADIYFKDSNQELNRQDFKLQLWNRDYKLTPDTTLDTDTTLWRTWYGQGDQYSNYKFNFDIDQKLPLLTDIKLGADYIYETGQVPSEFSFDFGGYNELTPYNDQFGWRHYYNLVFDGHSLPLGQSQIIKWQLGVKRALYETGEVYDNYRYEAKYQNLLTASTMVTLGYEYEEDRGDMPPLSRDEIYAKNNLNVKLDYEKDLNGSGTWDMTADLDYDLSRKRYTTAALDLEYRTAKKDLAYWQVGSNLEYDLPAKRYREKSIELKRIYDCMEFMVDWDFVRESGELGFEMKY